MNNKYLEALVWLDNIGQKYSTRHYPAEYTNEYNDFCQLQAEKTGSRIPTVEAFDNWLNKIVNND